MKEEESTIALYTADLTAEEMDADVVTVEPDRYKSEDAADKDGNAEPRDRK